MERGIGTQRPYPLFLTGTQDCTVYENLSLLRPSGCPRHLRMARVHRSSVLPVAIQDFD